MPTAHALDVHRDRLGRDGPQLSMVGARWPLGPGMVSAASAAGVNWLLVSSLLPGEAPIEVPVHWAIVVIGVERAAVCATLARLGRPVADVVLSPRHDRWASATALVDARVARCVGLVTDSPSAVERCNRRRHVDAVLTAAPPDAALVRVCRWSGTGILLTDGMRVLQHPRPTTAVRTAAD